MLLEIAALLEHAQNPDPGPVRAVRKLLRDRAVEVAKLRGTLEDLRKALARPQSVTKPRHWDPG